MSEFIVAKDIVSSTKRRYIKELDYSKHKFSKVNSSELLY